MYILCSMKTVISIKIDQDVKDQAKAMAASAGISLSTIVNAQLRQFIATRRIEFYAPEPMSPKLTKLIAEVEKERASGLVSKSFDTVEDMLKDLNS